MLWIARKEARRAGKEDSTEGWGRGQKKKKTNQYRRTGKKRKSERDKDESIRQNGKNGVKGMNKRKTTNNNKNHSQEKARARWGGGKSMGVRGG